MEGTKSCTKCGEVRPLSEFGRRSSAKDGRTSYCITCDRAWHRQHRASGRKRAYVSANAKNVQLGRMLLASKRRAKNKQLPHDIDLDYLRSIAPTHCPYLGTELQWDLYRDPSHSYCAGRVGGGRPYPDSPSLDKIVPSRGYVKGNVVIVSHRANAIKSNASEMELIEMGRRIAQLKMQLAIDEE